MANPNRTPVSKLIVFYNTRIARRILNGYQSMIQNTLDWMVESFNAVDPNNYREAVINNQGVVVGQTNNAAIQAAFPTLRGVLSVSQITLNNTLQLIQVCLTEEAARNFTTFRSAFLDLRANMPSAFAAINNIYTQLYNQIPESGENQSNNPEFLYNMVGIDKNLCIEAMENIFSIGYSNMETAQHDMIKLFQETPKYPGNRISSVLQVDWAAVASSHRRITVNANMAFRHFRDLRSATFYNATSTTLDKFPQTSKLLAAITRHQTELDTLRDAYVALATKMDTI